jgi:hypothetical protein
LVNDSHDAILDSLLITKICARERTDSIGTLNGFKITVEVVNERDACRYVKLGDCIRRDVVKILDESTQGVSMGCDQYFLTRL